MKEENGGELPERIVYVRPESLLSTECDLILIRVFDLSFLQPCASRGDILSALLLRFRYIRREQVH